MRQLDQTLLDEIIRRLVAQFQPEAIILFGSHAWGDTQEDSDIDLLVVVPHSNLSPTQRATQAYRCLRGIMVPLDILVKTRGEVERYRGVHASLVSRILEDGKLIYGRREAAAGV
jgi:predicted nucleotidyltransferase